MREPRTPVKPATPEECERAIREMPEWRKQKLADALLAAARRLGFIDENGNVVKEPETEGVRQ